MPKHMGIPIEQSLPSDILDALQGMLPDEQRTYLTVEEAVTTIRVPNRVIMGWIKSGRLPVTGSLTDPRINRETLMKAWEAEEARRARQKEESNRIRHEPKFDKKANSHKSANKKRRNRTRGAISSSQQWISVQAAAKKLEIPQYVIRELIKNRLVPSRGTDKVKHQVRIQDFQTKEIQRRLKEAQSQRHDQGVTSTPHHHRTSRDPEKITVPATVMRLKALDRLPRPTDLDHAERSRLRNDLRRIDPAAFEEYVQSSSNRSR